MASEASGRRHDRMGMPLLPAFTDETPFMSNVLAALDSGRSVKVR